MTSYLTQRFDPPYRILMGPGPSDVDPRVTAAMARPTIGHLDPLFLEMVEEIKNGLRYAFQTENAMTFPLSAPGSAGMEACFVNLVEPEDQVIVCQNGAFGVRMKENVERCGGQAIVVESEWGRPVDPEAVEEALKAHPEAKILAFVHAETSTGVRSNAEELCRLARAHDCLTIVDTVTSLGGIPVAVDEWGADAVYAGTQKCLSCPPGLAPVTFSPRALRVVQQRKTKVQSWFLDLTLLMGYWEESGGRTYHHTAPVNALYGLHEALLMLHEEGLENVWGRHRRAHFALISGLEALGLRLLVEPTARLPQLNAVCVPEGVDEAKLRRFLLDQFDLEIGAGLGPLAGRIWRIGLMGQSAHLNNVLLCLSALGAALPDIPAARIGEALAAAEHRFEASAHEAPVKT